MASILRDGTSVAGTITATSNVTVGGALGVAGAISGASLGVTGAITGDSVVTTNGPNKPVDNNDASMPSVGIGGFSYAVGSTSTEDAFPSINIPLGGTWVYIASSTRYDGTDFVTKVGRVAGGWSVNGLVPAGSDVTAYVYVIAWRIA